jgi:predicted peptidase
MTLLALVLKEYTIGPNRIYLMGHSMGGFATWWLGQQYADTWAAIAPMSGVPDPRHSFGPHPHKPRASDTASAVARV